MWANLKRQDSSIKFAFLGNFGARVYTTLNAAIQPAKRRIHRFANDKIINCKFQMVHDKMYVKHKNVKFLFFMNQLLKSTA